jgi:hypothetical protein
VQTITQDEFDIGMSRLKAMFGQEVAHPMRAEIIAKAMRKLTSRQWDFVIEQLIATCRTAPVLKDFTKIAEPMLQANAKTRFEEEQHMLVRRREQRQTCSKCDDVGIIQALKRGAPSASTYAFRCDQPGCMASQRAGTSTPMWDSVRYGSEFRVLALSETAYAVFQKEHVHLYGFPESDRGKPMKNPETEAMVGQVVSDIETEKPIKPYWMNDE